MQKYYCDALIIIYSWQHGMECVEYVCVCVCMCVLHWHSIKSPAPLKIGIHLITCKQQNINTMNAKTDFPDH